MTTNLTAALLILAMVTGSTISVARAENSCVDVFNHKSGSKFVSTAAEQEAEHTRLYEAFELSSPGVKTVSAMCVLLIYF